MSGFRITTWNVNGIRNPFGFQPWREQRTFQSMFDILESDVVVMQETKIQRKDLQDDMVLVAGWDVFFSLPKHKKGYSGVAIYTRNATCAPVRAEEGITGVLCPPKSTTSFRDLPLDQQIGGYPRPGQLSEAVEENLLDSEGRCVILEFPAFVLLGVYCPANRDESRVLFRTSFFEALDVRIRNLVSMGKQVILAGDLNVIGSEMDSTNVLESLRKENMTLDEWMSLPTRRIFNQLIHEGGSIGQRDENRQQPVLWDLCRNFHPTRLGMNTCWDTKRNTRPANNGSRIDYILCSDGIRDWFTFADIQEGLMGSDHCPVFAIIAERIKFKGNDTSLLDIMNPPGVFQQGKRVRDVSQKDLLPLSAKLIPEFDRRQSIRDMFFKNKKSASTGLAASAAAAVDVENDSGNDTENDADADASSKSGSTAKEAKTVDQNRADAALRANNSSSSNSNLDGNGPSEDSLGFTSANSLLANARPADSQKRPCEPIDDTPRKVKRSKSKPNGDANAQKQKTASGQRTLKGFFKPVTAAVHVHPTPSDLQESQHLDSMSQRTATNSTSHTTNHLPADSLGPEHASPARPSRSSPKCPQSYHSPTAPTSPQRVFDPIEAKESWSKLLGKRVAPRCEHNEPCISLVTKKPGVNRGMFDSS
ncbi:hypothetical protein E4U21_000857 [Claviceps maximensis]|nr:hypothetical protein E4U21_000857 [Claviceps maximensis]